MVYFMENPIKMDDWGYHYFGKHPFAQLRNRCNDSWDHHIQPGHKYNTQIKECPIISHHTRSVDKDRCLRVNGVKVDHVTFKKYRLERRLQQENWKENLKKWTMTDSYDSGDWRKPVFWISWFLRLLHIVTPCSTMFTIWKAWKCQISKRQKLPKCRKPQNNSW